MKQLKDTFPFYRNNPEVCYLDHAATTFMPDRVLAAWHEFHATNGLSGHRNNSPLSAKANELLDRSRQNILRYFHADTHYDIAFTRNATDALNVIAFGLQAALSAGDIILISSAEHHSNYLCWKKITQEKDAILVEIPLLDSGDLDYEFLTPLQGQPIKIISLSLTSNATGAQLNLNKIECLRDRHQAFLCLDISQSVSHSQLDLHQINADAYVLSAHKMYGPKGIGALILKHSVLSQLTPRTLGGGMVWQAMGSESQWFEDVRKLEAGTQDIASCLAWSEACDFLQEVDINKVQQHNLLLKSYLTDQLVKQKYIRLIPNGANSADNILAFVHNAIHSHDLEAKLNRQDIIIRTGHMCAQPLLYHLNETSLNRISWGIGSSVTDIERLLNCIKFAAG